MNLALIPARSGSKGVPNKNIHLLAGYPLLAWAIACAQLYPKIDEVWVSSDSKRYLSLAEGYGAKGLVRPAEYARGDSPDIDFVKHALQFTSPDYIFLLRPTTPLRDPFQLKLALTDLKHFPWMTSLRSVHKLSHPIEKLFRRFTWYLEPIYPEPDLPRQHFKPCYQANGLVDIIRVKAMGDDLYGGKVLPFITERTAEIDEPEDLEYAEWRLWRYGNPVYDYLKQTYPL